MKTKPPAVRAEADKQDGPRSSKGIRTRARLVQAAKEIFEEHGFLEARISDIAERAGLSYGSFYHYFLSKEEIFREVAEAQEPQLESEAPSGAGSIKPTGAGAVTEEIVAATRRYLSDYRDAARIMGVIEQVSRFDARVSAARFDRHRRYSERWARTIEYLQEREMADSDIDPVVGAYALVAMVTRFAEAWFVQRQLDCTFDEGVCQLTALCLNALQRPSRSTPPRNAVLH
jgi:AcrR family transcriptional regulator